MRDYFKNSIVYYYSHLKNEGCDDPVRVIISDFLETIKITDKQKEFIENNINTNKSDLKNIEVLLTKMNIKNSYDDKIIALIIKKINHILKECDK